MFQYNLFLLFLPCEKMAKIILSAFLQSIIIIMTRMNQEKTTVFMQDIITFYNDVSTIDTCYYAGFVIIIYTKYKKHIDDMITKPNLKNINCYEYYLAKFLFDCSNNY